MGGPVEHSKKESSDLVLLLELPFFPWPSKKDEFSRDIWERSVLVHDSWVAKLVELAPAAVVGTRPVTRNGRRLNEGFVWTGDGGYVGVHTKYYVPEEEGYWEATWYNRGDSIFEPAHARRATLGFLICSELWSMSHTTEYGKSRAHILVTPRATGKDSVEKWLAGGRACAVVSGCFSPFSNRVSGGSDAGDFGRQGWIIDQDGGVLATTSSDHPYVTRDIDLEAVVLAKTTYPRNCID